MLSKVLTLFKGRPLSIYKKTGDQGFERDEAGRIDRSLEMESLEGVRDAPAAYGCKGCGACGGGCGNNGSSFRLTNKGDKVA